MNDKEAGLNEAAYRQMEERIKYAFPFGHFVAIANGKIIGDSNDFLTLHKSLKDAGKDPRKVLIVQAGHIYPERATIFVIG